MSENRTAQQIQDEINALVAEQTAIRESERAAQREQAAKEAVERNAQAFATIAAEVGGDAERVGAFLAKVATESGFSVDYLVAVITNTPLPVSGYVWTA